MRTDRARLLLLAAYGLAVGCAPPAARTDPPGAVEEPAEDPSACPSCGGPIVRLPRIGGPSSADDRARHRAGTAVETGSCLGPPTVLVCRKCRLYGDEVGSPWGPLPSGFGTERAGGAAGEPGREAPRGPDVEAQDDQEPVSESTVTALDEEIARLERECVPARGVSRKQVEARFGEGRPAVVSKVPVEAPPESPHRVYEFCDDGVLGVQYDGEWRVIWAHFHNPYSSKGVAAGRTLPLEQRVHERRRRRAQMERIRDEFRRRFGE